MTKAYHPATRDAYQPNRIAQHTVAAVIHSFRAAGWSNREIGLLVSGHAGYLVRASTICALANGRTSGRRLARHFRALARSWKILGT
jgi:hypothetical protein